MEIEKLFELFISNESIISMNEIRREYKLNNKSYLELREYFIKLLGKDKIYQIQRIRLAKHANLARQKKGIIVSEETKQKISIGNKRYIASLSEDVRNVELSRRAERMKLYCAPNNQTAAAKKKRVFNRKRNNNTWHSDKTILKIRDSNLITAENRDFKPKGKNFNNRISKGHKQLMDLLTELNYNYNQEFTINRKWYDVFIPSNNLLLEFNGTFWHADPRFYPNDKIMNFHNNKVTAETVRKLDLDKINNALDAGYNLEIIWQYDWEQSINKKEFLINILKKYE